MAARCPVKLVIAGGAGSLGRRVAGHFSAAGADVVILTRTPRTSLPHRQVIWDGRTPGAWADELDGSVLLNLAGELVDRRPTRSNVELMQRSRIDPTAALVDAAATGSTPGLWLQMSTLARRCWSSPASRWAFSPRTNCLRAC